MLATKLYLRVVMVSRGEIKVLKTNKRGVLCKWKLEKLLSIIPEFNFRTLLEIRVIHGRSNNTKETHETLLEGWRPDLEQLKQKVPLLSELSDCEYNQKKIFCIVRRL